MEHAAHHGDDVLYNSLPGGQARIRILTHLSEKPVLRPGGLDSSTLADIPDSIPRTVY
jgi:hypothetical protein